MVGAVRFELTTSCTRNKRATRLRYAPTLGRKIVAVDGRNCNNQFMAAKDRKDRGEQGFGEKWEQQDEEGSYICRHLFGCLFCCPKPKLRAVDAVLLMSIQVIGNLIERNSVSLQLSIGIGRLKQQFHFDCFRIARVVLDGLH
jgi:hypothetical protein